MKITEQQKFITVAERLIKRGARVPVIAALLPLHGKIITGLYSEVNGRGSPKGPLPSHPNWYASALVPWRIIQCSLFVAFYTTVKCSSDLVTLEADILIGAYDMYLNHMNSIGAEACLSFDRAWHLMQMIRIKQLMLSPCTKCNHEFIMHANSLHIGFVCSLCNRTSSLRPSRFNQKLSELRGKLPEGEVQLAA